MTEDAYGMWPAAVISAGTLVFFTLSCLKPRKRWECRSMGVFGAFVVVLFTEMYGVPPTIYLLTSALGSRYPVLDPLNHINGHLWVVAARGLGDGLGAGDAGQQRRHARWPDNHG